MVCKSVAASVDSLVQRKVLMLVEMLVVYWGFPKVCYLAVQLEPLSVATKAVLMAAMMVVYLAHYLVGWTAEHLAVPSDEKTDRWTAEGLVD